MVQRCREMEDECAGRFWGVESRVQEVKSSPLFPWSRVRVWPRS